MILYEESDHQEILDQKDPREIQVRRVYLAREVIQGQMVHKEVRDQKERRDVQASLVAQVPQVERLISLMEGDQMPGLYLYRRT